MDTVARQGSIDRDGGVVAADVAARRQAQLEAAAGMVAEWRRCLPEHDSQCNHLAQIGAVIDDLAGRRDHSQAAMTTVRAIVCVSCRRLNAAQGKCFGKPLDQCMLLNRGRP